MALWRMQRFKSIVLWSFVAVQWLVRVVCGGLLCDTFEQIEKNDGELRQYRDIVVADDA